MRSREFLIILALCISLLASAGVLIALTGTRAETKKEQVLDLDLDRPAAIKIAEGILVKVYGERVLAQRPWIVREAADAFTIEGTFHNKSPYAKGGVATISIDRHTGKVTEISHGK